LIPLEFALLLQWSDYLDGAIAHGVGIAIIDYQGDVWYREPHFYYGLDDNNRTTGKELFVVCLCFASSIIKETFGKVRHIFIMD
jgi:hypothetical protein